MCVCSDVLYLEANLEIDIFQVKQTLTIFNIINCLLEETFEAPGNVPTRISSNMFHSVSGTNTKATPTVPVPTKNAKVFLSGDDDWHPSKMRGSETNSHDSIGWTLRERSIDHLGGQKWASLKSFFLLGGFWVATSGAEAEGGTGYWMVEATCHRWREEWGMRLYSRVVMDGCVVVVVEGVRL